MAGLKIVATEKAPGAIGPYSQAVTSGGFLFCSGQLPLDPLSGVASPNFDAQVRQALANLKAVLEAGGSSLDQVVKVGVFLKNMEDFPLFNRIYGEVFVNHKPARTTVEVSRLPKDLLIEIEAIGAL